jgi:biopolymer transport protein ExbD
MRIRLPPRTSRTDPMISFVNVVFLMVIFVALAGTVISINQDDLALPRTTTLPYDRITPERVLVVVDGDLTTLGRPLDLTEPAALDRLLGPAKDRSVEVFADRRMPAAEIVALIARLREAGASRIDLVTLDASP